MPKEVSEFWQQVYTRLTAIDDLMVLFSDDVVIRQTTDMLGTAVTFCGYQGVAALAAELAESFADIVWEPQKVIDLADGRHLVLLRTTGRGVASGAPVEAELGHLVRLRDGKIAELQTYVGWDIALKATGLSE